MDTIFNALGYGNQDTNCLVVFQLINSIAKWWEAEKVALGEEAIKHLSWEVFKVKFLGKYFLSFERDKKDVTPVISIAIM